MVCRARPRGLLTAFATGEQGSTTTEDLRSNCKPGSKSQPAEGRGAAKSQRLQVHKQRRKDQDHRLGARRLTAVRWLSGQTVTAPGSESSLRTVPTRQPVFCRPAAAPLTVSSNSRCQSPVLDAARTSRRARSCSCDSASTYGPRSAMAVTRTFLCCRRWP